MKKLILAALAGIFAVGVATAGPAYYCPPAKGGAKCPVECCPSGEVHISYMSDYFFRGVRHSRDAVGVGASYKFDQLPLALTLGFDHITSLSSNTNNYLGANGDHSNVYAAVGLPSLLGFDLGLRYDHYLYPNLRQPNGANNVGDSHGQLGLTISRDIWCGLNFAYTAAYDFNTPAYYAGLAAAGPGILPNNNDDGAWIHTLALTKSFGITDCLSLDLSGGVLYTDNVWPGGSGAARSAGWNSYFINASLPFAIGECATLAPYIGYNGTPDSWLADDIYNGIPGANRNDAFHGGVRFGVKF